MGVKCPGVVLRIGKCPAPGSNRIFNAPPLGLRHEQMPGYSVPGGRGLALLELTGALCHLEKFIPSLRASSKGSELIFQCLHFIPISSSIFSFTANILQLISFTLRLRLCPSSRGGRIWHRLLSLIYCTIQRGGCTDQNKTIVSQRAFTNLIEEIRSKIRIPYHVLIRIYTVQWRRKPFHVNCQDCQLQANKNQATSQTT